MNKEEKTRQISVRLSQSEFEMLERLSKDFGCSKSDILRDFTHWTDSEYKMLVNKALKAAFRLERAKEAVSK